MKQGTGTAASVGAMASALASLSCCLPLGFAAALGAASVSAFAERLRPWLLALSIALIVLGFWQQRRAKQCAAKRTALSAVLLWCAVAVVLGMVLFPQQVAGFLADGFSGAWK